MNALIKIFRLICSIILVYSAIFATTTALGHLFLYSKPQTVAVSNIERTTLGCAHFVSNIAKTDICRADLKISREFFNATSNDPKRFSLIFPSGIIIFLFFGLFFKNVDFKDTTT
jgi:hypothetical protein